MLATTTGGRVPGGRVPGGRMVNRDPWQCSHRRFLALHLAHSGWAVLLVAPPQAVHRPIVVT